MDFAKKQLESMGWTEGMGLGVNQNGIKRAIKPKLKFDYNGIGFESNESSNQWWNQSFNCSASYVDFRLAQTPSGLKLRHKSTEEDFKRRKSKKYLNFVKSSEIESKSNESEESVTLDQKLTQNIDFDEVFRQSGGRTAHKASRVGIKMSGKLKRIEEQNNDFVHKYKKLKSNE